MSNSFSDGRATTWSQSIKQTSKILIERKWCSIKIQVINQRFLMTKTSKIKYKEVNFLAEKLCIEKK